MTTTVLARKYRPSSFESMVGQGHVVQALTNALTQQRLHHAYLFTGTRGVGKTTVSRILAKSLNCTGPEGRGNITATPCGQCQPCCDIDVGRFVDYVELDAASNRGVEEISQLLEQAVYKPVVGRFKVYMIDEVHMLSNTAFNAMLKTLEEPPDYLKFVLATTDPQKVPVTVLSRCLQFNLRPMAAQTVQQHLAQVLDREGIAHDPGALRLLARAARGSMRDAMSLADQAIAFGGGTLQEHAVRQMLGSVDRRHVQRIVEAVAAGDGATLVAAVDTLRELGLSGAGTLEDLATALQRMAVVQAVPSMAQVADDSDPDAQTWGQLAPLLAPDETQLFYSLCLQGRTELALAPDEYSGLLMLLLRLLAFKPGPGGGGASPKAEGSVVQSSTAEPSRTPVALPVHLVAKPVLSAVAPSRAVGVAPSDDGLPAAPDLTFTDLPSLEPAPQLPDALSERWAELVAQMQSLGLITALVRELALQSQCVAQRDEGECSIWHLQVARESLCGDMHKERLSQALAQVLAREVRLEVQQGPVVNTPAQRDQAEREARQRAAEALIEGDALVRGLLTQYPSARIVSGSVVPL
jgi:DNA polymerase-3 subunit gamma/tau